MIRSDALIFVTTCMAYFAIGRSQDVNVAAVFPAIMEEERRAMQEPCDDHSQQQEYDFIVVGAGTAGCVVASRLTEVEDWDVLLLEAGEEETAIMDIPGLGSILVGSDVNWQYKTVPSNSTFGAFKNGQVGYAAGKVMGGGSSINGMFTIRGEKSVYDDIESLGNPGWKYKDVLSYFRKIERMEIAELENSSYHSTEGPIPISHSPYVNTLTSVLLEAGKEMGYEEVDYNGENMMGFSRGQYAMSHGTRWSSSRGYLHPIRDRKNLHVKKGALVRRVLIDEVTKTAYGVEYTKEGKNHTVLARKEVILSAGAIKSPQLLMLSGVGPREHLQEFNIKVIQDSKVGYNALENGGFYGLIFTMNDTSLLLHEGFPVSMQGYFEYYASRTGPLTSTFNMNMISFVDISPEKSTPREAGAEILWTYPGVLNDKRMVVALGINQNVIDEYISPLEGIPFYQGLGMPLTPRSKGRVSLQDANIETHPLIDPNLYGDEEDVKTGIATIRKIIQFTETQALQRLGAKLYDKPLPQCKDHEFGSDDYWRCCLRQFSFPAWHLSGTCKMGPSTDDSAVVSPQLKVHGINGLRVIDASIFPIFPAPHTMMPTYLAGEKGADLIKEEYLN